MGKISDFAWKIISWYDKHKRNLPWRQTTDPYLIWLSEVILQQTRIDQGTSYYLKFAKNYPTVKKLAKASEDEILKHWQGLGYYSRARNLHFTAKQISNEHNGKFPSTYKEILSLKGIGEYTAAAISSIAFNLPHASVDGNVHRLISRYFEIEDAIDSSHGKKLFKKIAEENMDSSQPGIYNQAMMELGALVCKPKNPDCNICPLNENCIARFNGTIDKLPVKKSKTKVTDRFFNYLVIEMADSTYIRKRDESDIWKSLYEFPLIETAKKESTSKIISEITKICNDNNLNIRHETNWKKHILSHQRIHYRFISIHLSEEKERLSEFTKVNKKDIFNFAVPRLIERELNNIFDF